MATSAAAVANQFLRLAKEDGMFIDQMKLQKLLFYAQAWMLGIMGTELYPDDIHAWEWGPVIPSVYYQTRKFGRQPITENIKALDSNGVWVSQYPETPDVLTHIKRVWDIHKSLTGIQLSNATHAPGEPWDIVKNSYGGDLSTKPNIPTPLIESVFREKAAS
jgi:uncharacterized phage-associated protein